MGDEVFDMPEVLAFDENTLAEHLQFFNNVKLTYEKSTFLGITTINICLQLLVVCINFVWLQLPELA